MKNSLSCLCATALLLSALAAATPAAPFKDKKPEPTRTLTGRVLSRQNAPLSEAVIYLTNTRSREIKTYISEPDGTYRFPGLSLNVDYQVYAEHNGARSDTKTVSSFDTRTQVEIVLRIK